MMIYDIHAAVCPVYIFGLMRKHTSVSSLPPRDLGSSRRLSYGLTFIHYFSSRGANKNIKELTVQLMDVTIMLVCT